MLVNWHKALGLAACATLAGMGLAAHAAELQVTATLPDSCTVANGTLAFGTVDPSGGSTPTANTTFNVQCSTTGSVTIALDGGAHYQQGTNGRAMKRASSNNYLDYELYTTAAQSTAWPVPGGISKPVVVGANPVAVFGAIAANQVRPGGQYSDTVQITMTVN